MKRLLFGQITGIADGTHLARTRFHSSRWSPLHTHDFYEVFLVLNGPLEYEINHASEILHPRSLIFVTPSDLHRFRCLQRNKNATIVNIALSPDLLQTALGYLGQTSVLKATELRHFTLRGLSNKDWKMILEILGHTGEWSTDKIPVSIRIKSFLTLILNLWIKGCSTETKKLPVWLQTTLLKMEEPSNFKTGLEKMISLSGKTQEYLTRSMRKLIGLTPTAYINGLRLEEAKRLIQTTDLDILDIIEESGFHNISHFMRLFKIRFGTTPQRFKNSAKKIFGQ